MSLPELDHQTEEILYKINEVLEASGQAVLALDERGYVVYSTPLADKLLTIEKDAGDQSRRKINARLKSLQDEPLTSLTECKADAFPLMVLAKGDGLPDRVLRIIGVPGKRMFLIQDQSAELQRGAVERELLDVAAHDLRAGLVPAKTYAQMLLTSIFGPVNEKQSEALQAIDNCVQKQAEKISGLLDMVKAEENRLEVQLETASLPELIKHAMDIVERDCKRRNIRIAADLDLRVALVEADVARIQRIFTSLMMRGVKQSSSGGAIGIELKYFAGSRARIRLWDVGSGNAPEDLEVLTTPAARISQERSSGKRHTDIELGAVYDILKQHKGSIEADSVPGAGTTCRIYLPVRQKSTTTILRSTQRLPVLNAMIVHNELPEAETVCEVLQSRGLNIFRTTSGKEAVRAAREKHYALVFISDTLSDLDLPRTREAIRLQRPEDPQQICTVRHDPHAGDSMQNGNDTWLGGLKKRDVAEKIVSDMISKLIETP